MVTCTTCGTENPPGSRFCNSCGAALAAEAPPAREERRVVTVLFCDLVGFTSRAERLDPEDVHAVLGGYHERVRRELQRYGGTVEKFIGDAVMALFGAPVAHEDDPERAVRAALAIREDIAADDARADGRDLHVRVGITTGEALVNLSARAEAGEAAAAGDVVNTAARLQAAAPVDGILVDEPTFRATERVIAFGPAPPVTAKGKAEPVAAWTAREAKARLGMDVAHTATSELVGRKHEVGGLRQALARVRRERSAQLVTLVGVPGIGKSRLVHELLRAVDDDPELIVWRQGRSLPYGMDAGYWALGEMLKAQAGILETDDDDAAAAKLAAAVRAVMPEADDAPWVERHLRPLAGLGRDDASGEVGRDEAFAAWRRFWEALADSGPTVLVFEDLHWADDGLLDFVDHLADWATSVPLLLVCTARPELMTRRPGWGGGKTNASTISLAPLSDEDTARLVLSLLETSVLDAGFQSALLARAGGNPLYAEEFVRMTRERGLSSTPDLPETVQGIIAARLDGLDPEAKGLIQDAAVVGKIFWLGALTAVDERDRFESERQLHELERRQLVRRERRSSVGSEVEYAFWHVLVRDVAYGQIPRAARADKHRATAEWIGSLVRDRVADQAELIAHHYVSALELARAAGRDTAALERPAREALRAAGERALTLHSFAPAARFFEQALALWPENDAERAYVLFGYGRARFAGADEGRETLEEARDLFLAAGDAENAAAAETMIGELAWILGRPPEYLAAAERAAGMLADRPPSRAKAYAHASRVRGLMLGGRDADAIEAAAEALELAEQLGDEELRASVLNSRGTARANLGDRGGLRDLEQSIDVAERVGSPEGIRGYINLASVSQAWGEFARGAELHERGLELAHRFGQARGIRFLEAERSYDLFATGAWDEAERAASEFIREVEAGSPHYQESQSRGLRAWIALGRGDDARALADTERLLEQARELREPQVLYPALAWGATFLAALGGEEKSRALMDELLSIEDALRRPTAWAMTAVEPVARFGLEHRVLPALDAVPKPSPYDEAAALYLRGRFAEAADVLEATGFLVLEAHARTRAAEAAVAAGRRAEADAHLARAISFYRAAGATRFLRDAEALLAASA